MANAANSGSGNDSDWDQARAIWAAGKVEIPQRRNKKHAHLLGDLKRAAGMFMQASEVTETDQTRKPDLNKIARQCRSLSDSLCNLDGVALWRMDRALLQRQDPGADDMETLLPTVLGDLSLLLYALENAPRPPKARKRKHDIDDFLIIRLAEIYEGKTGKPPSVTTDPVTNERGGPFVDFVNAFVEHMLPEIDSTIDGRVIQRALALRKKWPEDPLKHKKR